MSSSDQVETEAAGASDHGLNRGGDEMVGYGKPPREHQFQPGKSGNLEGRPKGAKSLRTELREELGERVVITVDGRRRKVSKLRVIIKALTAKAAKGNVAAADKLLGMMIQAFGFEDERSVARPLSETDLLMLTRFLDEEAPASLPTEAAQNG